MHVLYLLNKIHTLNLRRRSQAVPSSHERCQPLGMSPSVVTSMASASADLQGSTFAVFEGYAIIDYVGGCDLEASNAEGP